MSAVKSIIEAVSFTMQEEERQWFADEIPVLRAELSTPQCSRLQSGRVSRRLNRYYRQCARAFLAYCSHYLYPQALNAFEQARQAGAPLPCAAAQLHCTVTCNQNQVLSLYIDCTEWVGTRDALTLRRYFNGRNFYLSDGGLHFFYQPCCIAPALEGCPTFFLPFSPENGPLWPLNPHQNLAK